MKSLVMGLLLLFGASARADNVLVVNGQYQIPVQAVLALESIRDQLRESVDWKQEALDVMRESLELIRIGEAMNNQVSGIKKKQPVEVAELVAK